MAIGKWHSAVIQNSVYFFATPVCQVSLTGRMEADIFPSVDWPFSQLVRYWKYVNVSRFWRKRLATSS